MATATIRIFTQRTISAVFRSMRCSASPGVLAVGAGGV
jgi:hypothetical protein